MVTALYTQSGMILLFYLLDTETYGYYRALFVIITPVYLITVSMSQVVLSYLKKLSGKSLLKNFRKLQLYSFLVGFGILLLLYFFKDFIFQLIKVPSNDISLLAFVIVLATALTRLYSLIMKCFLSFLISKSLDSTLYLLWRLSILSWYLCCFQ